MKLNTIKYPESPGLIDRESQTPGPCDLCSRRLTRDQHRTLRTPDASRQSAAWTRGHMHLGRL